MADTTVSREQFDRVMNALWGEIEYQNNLPRRTEHEAKDVPGFLTLARHYERQIESNWVTKAGVPNECLNGLRKLAAIYVRAMVYCGTKPRVKDSENFDPREYE